MALVREVSIENYKSIRKLTLELGRVNVLIGANGSGKSNVLEAIALGSAAARNKLDNEYLVPRGIRVTEPRFMRSAFPGGDPASPVVVTFQAQDKPKIRLPIDPERRTFALPGPSFPAASLSQRDTLRESISVELLKRSREDPAFQRFMGQFVSPDQVQAVLLAAMMDAARDMLPPELLIYAPENSALRIFQTEPQILPLGIKGEGLFAHLKALSAPEHADRLAAI